MISLADLKQLIYRESGYKIQVQDNDPILAAFYVNLATLGEALKHAEQVQNIAKDVINSLPGAADNEMQRAGDAALQSLSSEVGRIAQRLAGDAANAEKTRAIANATKWTAAGLLVSALAFGGLGYGIRMLADKINLNIAKEKIIEANDRAAAEIAVVKKQARDEIESMKNSIGWLGTPQGRIAKRFFDYGGGLDAATCNSPVWQVIKNSDGKYCIPNRRELFGGDQNKYGWKLP